MFELCSGRHVCKFRLRSGCGTLQRTSCRPGPRSPWGATALLVGALVNLSSVISLRVLNNLALGLHDAVIIGSGSDAPALDALALLLLPVKLARRSSLSQTWNVVTRMVYDNSATALPKQQCCHHFTLAAAPAGVVPTTLLLLAAVMVAQANAQGARSLLQSTPCGTDRAIPKCADKACFIRSLPGVTGQVPMCATCLPGYIKINKGRACGEPHHDGSSCCMLTTAAGCSPLGQ
jgi:hypothetical protein